MRNENYTKTVMTNVLAVLALILFFSYIVYLDFVTSHKYFHTQVHLVGLVINIIF